MISDPTMIRFFFFIASYFYFSFSLQTNREVYWNRIFRFKEDSKGDVL